MSKVHRPQRLMSKVYRPQRVMSKVYRPQILAKKTTTTTNLQLILNKINQRLESVIHFLSLY